MSQDKIEIMMVQLLFKERPKTPTTTEMRAVLEKYVGDLGEVPFAEPSAGGEGDMFMFPLLQYRAITKENPDGVPTMATFLGSKVETCMKVDQIQRSQFWNVEDGNQLIDQTKFTLLITTTLGAALPYKQQAQLMVAQVRAALDCYPECQGIYAPQTGKLLTPEYFRELKEISPLQQFIQLFVNARFFNISDKKEMIVDTLGFGIFGGADVQIHFKNMDPNHVVEYAYNIASYQFENEFPIKSGETIDSTDENGRIQMTPQWKVQYEESMVDPLRTVLDINCGKNAGGDR